MRYTFPMIQIFGTNKNFDCKAAQRFFKERRVPFQFIDLKEKEMSAGEFDSVVTALSKREGGRTEAVEALVDKKSSEYSSFAYLDDSEKEDKLFDNQLKLLKQPVCRNGKTDATVGMEQKIWETWK
jgi:arsenate reductase-like glutaredoxin family protein